MRLQVVTSFLPGPVSTGDNAGQFTGLKSLMADRETFPVVPVRNW